MTSITSSLLETSTHKLHLFSSLPPPYFVLIDKSLPTKYIPAKLCSDSLLIVDPIPTPDADDDHHYFSVLLAGKNIGKLSSVSSDFDQLAKFVTNWESALQELETFQTPNRQKGFKLLTESVKSKLSFLTANNGADTAASIFSSKSAEVKTSPSSLVDKIYDQRSEFLDLQKLSVRLVTWNLHGGSLRKTNFNNLLGLSKKGTKKYQLYVIGFQETDPFTTKNLSVSNNSTLENTLDLIISALGGPNKFKIISTSQMLGLSLIVIAESILADQFRVKETNNTGTGLFGIWGNKGAVCTKLEFGGDAAIGLKGTELNFINCHLTAGESEIDLQRRKWELQEIGNKAKISGLSKGEVIVDQSITFLLGDMNYRVELDPDLVQSFSDTNEIETILAHDQLQQKSNLLSSNLFTEQEITFLPTYKYTIGTEKFDFTPLSNGTKARTPSYTDRILFTANERLTPVAYKSIQDYTLSDHKPVYADFTLDVFAVDPQKRKTVLQEILKQADDRENSIRPTIVVEPREIISTENNVLVKSAVEISFQQQTIFNTGAVEWELISNNPDITVEPSFGILPYGIKQYVEVSCKLPISREIQGVAILRVKDVQDIFIPIEFCPGQTFLGKSLQDLAGNTSQSEFKKMPKPIWFLIDYLLNNFNLLPKDLFMSAKTREFGGSPEQEEFLSRLQDTLNRDSMPNFEIADSDNMSIYGVAKMLIVLLENLPGKIIPSEFYYSHVFADRKVNPSLGAAVIELMERLPSVNVNVLVYLKSFLRNLIETGTDSKQLSKSQILFFLFFANSFLVGVFDSLIIERPKEKEGLRERQARKEFLNELIGI
jgi:hypothetical protein